MLSFLLSFSFWQTVAAELLGNLILNLPQVIAGKGNINIHGETSDYNDMREKMLDDKIEEKAQELMDSFMNGEFDQSTLEEYIKLVESKS